MAPYCSRSASFQPCEYASALPSANMSSAPSTVSAHINAVERLVGGPVVARTADGSRLTSAGRQVVAVARMIVGLYEHLDDLHVPTPSQPAPPGRGVTARGTRD